MNHSTNRFPLVIIFLLIFSFSQAQRPDFSLTGFATENGGTTGGEGGTVLHVSTYADLKKYAEEANTKYIIYVTGTIYNNADGGSIRVASNKSIIGRGDNTLLNGVGLTINNVRNIIIQNLRITMQGVTTRIDKSGVYSSTGDEGRPQILMNGGDCIRLTGTSKNVWIDHCELFSVDPAVQTNIDLYDGMIDITGQTGFVTVSWCYIHDHHKCHLLGGSETDIFADRKVTFHHNYYSNIKSRLPLQRGSTGHVFNNYFYHVNAGSEARMRACIRSEKNYFEDSKSPVYSSADTLYGFAEIIDNKKVNTTDGRIPQPCVAAIPYNYSTLLTNNTDSVKLLVKLFAGTGKLQGTCTPKISTSKATVLCAGDSVKLTAPKGSMYVWRKDSVQVDTTSTLMVKSEGSYTLEHTDTLGCRAVSNPVIVDYYSSLTWFADIDKDGKGDPNTKQAVCDQPAGYVRDSSDLCPNDANKIAAGNCGCGKTEQSCIDCNNIINGTAMLDTCSRCVGGNTNKVACYAAHEAETEACKFDGAVESSNINFKGTGYINTPNAKDATIAFSIESANAGNATISFRYANGTAINRPAVININDSLLANGLNFPGTSGFTLYKTVEMTIPLKQGLNTLKLVAGTADGLANIDQIGYVTQGLKKGTCAVFNGINLNPAEASFHIYPNPFQDRLSIEEAGRFQYRIFDICGKLIESGSFTDKGIIAERIQPGLYLLEIKKDITYRRARIIKQ